MLCVNSVAETYAMTKGNLRRTELTLANETRQMKVHYSWVEARQQAVGMVAGAGS